ncbi:hypothetical protein TbgDal_III3080 [Trypanosoma brucei gambiense DAL972]|uniref:Uncharacterized protein n=1 Tax=Trypanosoma brucei gambiense (strain MHOM/CI/86/DAL972) TaxID=679716 RepID=C9ZKK4_TRYB9|nr:hypothetical protein TbgDal_III3080 [Trypanosoma brucei gambiense DAL972]CBH09970.1 hypothetical protein TbgDal_III3080 [Trypanosoma brucei gambiense DAL972]|eukprot:XP_011772261.1 hypothetical protein TbgDal_III3080 [Trypanosoma brucei gambiense DAL972]
MRRYMGSSRNEASHRVASVRVCGIEPCDVPFASLVFPPSLPSFFFLHLFYACSRFSFLPSCFLYGYYDSPYSNSPFFVASSFLFLYVMILCSQKHAKDMRTYMRYLPFIYREFLFYHIFDEGNNTTPKQRRKRKKKRAQVERRDIIGRRGGGRGS